MGIKEDYKYTVRVGDALSYTEVGSPYLITILDENKRVTFSIVVMNQGSKIEVRGVDIFKHGNKLYTQRLILEPVVSNLVEISHAKYED